MKSLFNRLTKSYSLIRKIILGRDNLKGNRNSLIQERDNLISQTGNFDEFVPPGHFYSAIPSLPEIIKYEKRIWNKLPEYISGIELNAIEQLELLEVFHDYYKAIPFKDKKTRGLRYYFLNSAYSYSDGIFLHCMIRHAKPKKIIEVGSGYSSCVTLDTNELFLITVLNVHLLNPILIC